MQQFIPRQCEAWVRSGHVPANVWDREKLVAALLAQYKTDPEYYDRAGWCWCFWALDRAALVAEGVLEY